MKNIIHITLSVKLKATRISFCLLLDLDLHHRFDDTKNTFTMYNDYNTPVKYQTELIRTNSTQNMIMTLHCP